MRCRRCQAELNDSQFCPNCGCDVSLQKRASIISNLYYNKGLEKAQIRDLSGAVDLLVRSLKFNKKNIQARNLLGLVYFEMGEAVAALSEWVISDNLQTSNNLAAEYIAKLKANANKLDTINLSIKKYNEALEACRAGHTDTAAIQLKKVLNQNPKLIKAYHLLALVYMKDHDYRKARRVLKKAARIDKTNSTTLRFLDEIDTKSGYTPEIFGRKDEDNPIGDAGQTMYMSENDVIIQPPAFRERSAMATVLNLCLGIAIGAAVIWFLAVPAIRSDSSQDANDKVVEYSNTMASQSKQIEKLQEQIAKSEETVDSANEQIQEAEDQVTTYENLMKAYAAYQEGNYSSISSLFDKIDESTLSVDAHQLYDDMYEDVSTYLFNHYSTVGEDYFYDGDYDNAIENLLEAVKIKDDDYNTLDLLAHAYRYQGKTKKAIEYFQKIVDQFPGTTSAQNAQDYIDALKNGTDTTDTYTDTEEDEDTDDTGEVVGAEDVTDDTTEDW